MFYQAIKLGMRINAIIILCSKYGIIKLFNLYYFLTRKWEGMVSVSVPVLDRLDRHILLDAMLSFQPWLFFSYKESLLSITACLPILLREKDLQFLLKKVRIISSVALEDGHPA